MAIRGAAHSVRSELLFIIELEDFSEANAMCHAIFTALLSTCITHVLVVVHPHLYLCYPTLDEKLHQNTAM